MVKAPRLEELVKNIDCSKYSNQCPSVMLFEICSGTLDNNLDKKQEQIIKHKNNFLKVLEKYDQKAELYTSVLFVNGKYIEDHLDEIDASINYILYGNREEVTSSVSEYYSSKNKEVHTELSIIEKDINKIINNKSKGNYGHELEDYIHVILEDQISSFSTKKKCQEYDIHKRFKYRKNGDIDILSIFDKKLIGKELNPIIFKNFEPSFGFNFIKRHNRVFMYNKNPADSRRN